MADGRAHKGVPKVDGTVAGSGQTGGIDKGDAQKGFAVLLIDVAGRHAAVAIALAVKAPHPGRLIPAGREEARLRVHH